MANEKRLIELDHALQAVAEQYTTDTTERELNMFCDIRQRLRTLPTVDAVPVVHGKWGILDDGYGCELMCCSVCKSEFYDGDNDTVDHLHNYCPNCGAKMDGDGNGTLD